MKPYKIWLLGLCISIAPLAAQSAILSVVAPASDEVGSSFDAQIFITDVLDFAGFEFDLNFSNPDLTATALVSGGVFDPDTFDITNDISVPGVATLSESSLAFSGLDINTATLIGTVSLSVAANASLGPTVLSLSNVVLSDSLGDPISGVSLQPATVNITAPSAAPIPGSLWLMGLALVVGSGWRRRRKALCA